MSKRFIIGVLNTAALLSGSTLVVADGSAQEADELPSRPSIMFNRWQEEWSVLADPRVPRELLDSLKYIRLSADDPEAYLSFGANLSVVVQVTMGACVYIVLIDIAWFVYKNFGPPSQRTRRARR